MIKVEEIKMHAKQIYQSVLGSPVKEDAIHMHYHVPWRTDRTASLLVNKRNDAWFDNPRGDTGDVLGLVARVNSLDPRKQFRKILEIAAEHAGLRSTAAAAEETPTAGPIIPVPRNATPPPRTHPKYGAPIATWKYQTTAGETIGYVARFDTKPRKSFRPLFYTMEGWQWSYTAELYPLYGLERLSRTGEVLLCEGEKTADAAATVFPELISMSWMGGAGRERKIDFTPLKGRRVTLWPDADVKGTSQKAMEYIAGALIEIGCEVRMVRPPASLPDKWDLADPAPQGVDLQQILSRARAVGPAKIQEVCSTEIAKTEYPDRPWLLDGILSIGMAMIAAAPKIGKTYWCEDLALHVSCGRPFMNLPVRPGRVLYIDPEQAGAIVKQRQKQLGWPDGSDTLDFIFDEFQFNESGFAFLDDYIHRKPDTVLIIADTLARTVPVSDRRGKNAYQAEYAEMVPIQRWALDHGLTLLFVHHTNKLNPKDATEAYDAGAGSRGLSGAMESLLTFKRTKTKDVFAMNVTLRHGEGKDLALKKNGFKWELLGDFDNAMVGQDRAAILKLLHANGAMTPAEIGETLDKKRGAIQQLLLRMAKSGLVESAGAGHWQCGTGVGSYYDSEGKESV